ncbi:MAG TPA: outer membrane beta-barrel protein [Methylomirabilota bacterium]|nr:outer membrane beta-barrel protein [Methylomirabilota bacterium]
MKTIFRSFVLPVSCVLGLFALPEPGRSQGFYLDASAGVSLAENVDLDQFLVRTPGMRMKLDPGGRLSVAAGYNFSDYFGVQIETGSIINNIESITGRGNVDALLMHTPLLVNAVLRYDKADCKWVPYLGAGAGGDVSVIVFDEVTAPNGAVVDGAGSAVVFAWQAFAGVRYKITERISVGAGYKFFWADSPSWDVEDTSGDIEGGKALVHSVVASFNFRF